MAGSDLNVLALLIREETRETVESTLSEIKGLELTVAMNCTQQTLADISDKNLPNVILLEINGHSHEDISELETVLAKYRERLTVFVTYEGGDVDVMRRLMRAGVSDAIPQPINAEELSLCFTNVLTEKSTKKVTQPGQRGAVIALHESRGGSGATTLAVNIAHMLANDHAAKTLLIDMDIQFGDVAMALDIHPVSHIMDALLDHERIDPVFVRALVSSHDSGLDVLAAPNEIAPICNISEDAVVELIETARTMYEFVILDVPSLYTPWSIAALKLADPLYVVIQNRLETVIHAKKIIEHLPYFDIMRDRVEVINNRAKSDITSVSIERLKETINLSRIHRVRNDYKTALTAADRGVPVAEISKKSIMTKDIQALSQRILLSHRGELQNNTKKGLLANLFSLSV